jgi:3-hydroxyisobutyrate dehydrogenase-like beta-hydroxyacid dehydrogenase
MQEMQTLGLLGLGEAAAAIAGGLNGLRTNRPEKILAWKRPPVDGGTTDRAEHAGVLLREDIADVAGASDVVFSLVAPTASVEVARLAAAYCSDKFYVDLNATALRAMEECAEIIETAGGHFVDGAIMGPLGRQGHRVSTVVSGKQAEALAGHLCAWDMDVRAIGTRPGLASTVKMIRSVYTKGLEAIVLEFMIAAHKHDATELVLESLEEILRLGPFLRPFREMISELVDEQVDHAPRRAAEMEQVVQTLDELGVEPKMARGTLATLSEVAAAGLRDELSDAPRTTEAILEILSRRS